jgi:hypothetical protein
VPPSAIDFSKTAFYPVQGLELDAQMFGAASPDTTKGKYL